MVVLYIYGLSSRNDVSLFDVPGYDSPMIYHREQTKLRAKDLDGVIFLKA